MKTITRDELWSSIEANKSVTLVEALSQEEFDKGHIPGAIRMTKDEVNTMAPQLLKDKNAKIVVYCANLECNASPAVAGKLMSLGYKDVSDYKEGKADWIAAGHPIEPAKATATV